MTNETGAAAGWYADPMGRYEHRYYNGHGWTADVSTGGERFVDPSGLTPSNRATTGGPTATPPQGATSAKNAPATAAMVLGIVAVSISWLPFVVVLGAIAALLAIVFAVVGLRRSARTGVGRSFAITGLVTAVASLVTAVIGVALTMTVLDVYDDYLDPQPNTVEVTTCEIQGSRATMTGTLENLGRSTEDFSVLIGFVRPGTDNPDRTERVAVDDVPAGETAAFEAQSQVDLDEVDCIVVAVNGPLPFGLAID